MNTILFILLFHFVNGICEDCPPRQAYKPPTEYSKGGNGNQPCGHGNQPACVPLDKNIAFIMIAGILIGAYKLKPKIQWHNLLNHNDKIILLQNVQMQAHNANIVYQEESFDLFLHPYLLYSS